MSTELGGDKSLHFLFAYMSGFHRSCSPLHSLFNPKIQTKIRHISISNNFEHLLKNQLAVVIYRTSLMLIVKITLSMKSYLDIVTISEC